MKGLTVRTVVVIILFLIAIMIVFWFSGVLQGQSNPVKKSGRFQELCWKWYNAGCSVATSSGNMQISGLSSEDQSELSVLCKGLYGSISECRNICLNACNPLSGGG